MKTSTSQSKDIGFGQLPQCREFLHKAFVLMDVTSMEFPLKRESMDLMGAVLHLIDSELGSPSGSPRPQSLLMAQELVQTVCARQGFGLSQIAPDISALVTYNVELEVSRKGRSMKMKKFVDIPANILPENYCHALFAASPNFLSCQVLGSVTPEERKALASSQVQRSRASDALGAKMQEVGLLTAVETVMRQSGRFTTNWPKDLPGSIANRVVAAKNFVTADSVCLSVIGKSMGVRRVDLKTLECSSIVFVVVHGSLRAVTFTDLLKNPRMPEILQFLPGEGISWEVLRSLAEN